MLLADYESAFEFINQEYIWKALRRQGVSMKLIYLIKEQFNSAKYRVLNLPGTVDISSGVYQR